MKFVGYQDNLDVVTSPKRQWLELLVSISTLILEKR
jgi:hypothetical protein